MLRGDTNIDSTGNSVVDLFLATSKLNFTDTLGNNTRFWVMIIATDALDFNTQMQTMLLAYPTLQISEVICNIDYDFAVAPPIPLRCVGGFLSNYWQRL